MTGRPAVKFCGLTRPEDAEAAVDAGASYLGVIFAGGPRRITAARACEVLNGSGTARRVGVFGQQPLADILRTAEAARLDVVQLHHEPDPHGVEAVRARLDVEVWAALRVRGVELPALAAALYDSADVVVWDPRVEGMLGGTGHTLEWSSLKPAVSGLRARGVARTALAGGLTPYNVARAVGTLSPDIVDVSSGVESSPGIKDHALLRAFAAAVRTSQSGT